MGVLNILEVLEHNLCKNFQQWRIPWPGNFPWRKIVELKKLQFSWEYEPGFKSEICQVQEDAST